MKNKIKIITFFILFFVGVAFAGVGCYIPPTGEISGSLLIFIGQVFVLAAAVWGFEVHFDIKAGKLDAGKRLEDNNDEGNENTAA